MIDLSNTYITLHSTLAITIVAWLLSMIVLITRSYKMEKKPSHKNVKEPYAITIIVIWVIVMLLILN